MKATIKEKRILSNLWGEYAQYIIDYQRSDGRTEEQIREIQHNGNGAASLLYNLEKREVMLIKQFRLATMINENPSGIIIEVCAGLIEENNPEASIKKEIIEEMGLVINQVDFHFKGYATPGAKTELIYYFTAAYNDETPRLKGGGRLDEQEDIIVFTLPFDEAYNMIFTQEIIDAKTIALLMYAKINIFGFT